METVNGHATLAIEQRELLRCATIGLSLAGV